MKAYIIQSIGPSYTYTKRDSSLYGLEYRSSPEIKHRAVYQRGEEATSRCPSPMALSLPYPTFSRCMRLM